MTNFKIHHLYRKEYTKFERYGQIGNLVNVFLVTDQSQKVPITYFLTEMPLTPTIYYPADMLTFFGYPLPNYQALHKFTIGFVCIADVPNSGGILYSDIIDYCKAQGITITEADIRINVFGIPDPIPDSSFCVTGGGYAGPQIKPNQSAAYFSDVNKHRIFSIQQMYSYVPVEQLDIWITDDLIRDCDELLVRISEQPYDVVFSNEVIHLDGLNDANYALNYPLISMVNLPFPWFCASGNSGDKPFVPNKLPNVLPYIINVGTFSFFDTSNNKFTPINSPPVAVSAGVDVTTANYVSFYSEGKYYPMNETIPHCLAFTYQTDYIPPYPNDPQVYFGDDPGPFPCAYATLANYGGPYYGLLDGVLNASTVQGQGGPPVIIGTSFSVIAAAAFYLLSSSNLKGSAYEVSQKLTNRPNDLCNYICCGKNAYAINSDQYWFSFSWAPSTGYGILGTASRYENVDPTLHYLYIYDHNNDFVCIYGSDPQSYRQYGISLPDPVFTLSSIPHQLTLFTFELVDPLFYIYKVTGVLGVQLFQDEWQVWGPELDAPVLLTQYNTENIVYIAQALTEPRLFLFVNGQALEKNAVPYPWRIKSSFKTIGTVNTISQPYFNLCDAAERYYLQSVYDPDDGKDHPRILDTFYQNTTYVDGVLVWTLQPQWFLIPLTIGNRDRHVVQGWIYNMDSQKYLAKNGSDIVLENNISDALFVLDGFYFFQPTSLQIDTYEYMYIDPNHNLALGPSDTVPLTIYLFPIDPSLMVKNEDILVLTGLNPTPALFSICVQSSNRHAPSIQALEDISDLIAIYRGLAFRVNSVRAGTLISQRNKRPFVLNTLMPTITLWNYPDPQDQFLYEFSNCFISVNDNGGWQPCMVALFHDGQEDPVSVQQQWKFQIRNQDTIGINYMYIDGRFFPETQTDVEQYQLGVMTNDYNISGGGHQPAIVDDKRASYYQITKIIPDPDQ